ncbi:Sec-independent protein translocase protein TatB [Amphibiibacter pelophylacis]|uniref:Sec-independent protein translocase protein TatB n=1 Tax=Amphibiibacter pelophylacis TaxID=1799477 RepID=A0ACC6P151_9BURK
MIDFGFDKLALIGVVALVVIGPEKLPRVARTVGHLMGRAQRYMADVKAEVNRSMALDELKQMRSDVETAAAQARDQFRNEVRSAEQDWDEAIHGPRNSGSPAPDNASIAPPDSAASPAADSAGGGFSYSADGVDGGSSHASSSWSTPLYPLPARKSKASWRARRSAVPAWYKQRHHLRSQAQNAAARVSRFRPASKSMRG